MRTSCVAQLLAQNIYSTQLMSLQTYTDQTHTHAFPVPSPSCTLFSSRCATLFVSSLRCLDSVRAALEFPHYHIDINFFHQRLRSGVMSHK